MITDYLITSEIESLQTIVISKNEQLEERKSYVTLQLQISYHIIIVVKPLQTEIFDKTSQEVELQSLLKIKTEELESLQERMSSLFGIN